MFEDKLPNKRPGGIGSREFTRDAFSSCCDICLLVCLPDCLFFLLQVITKVKYRNNLCFLASKDNLMEESFFFSFYFKIYLEWNQWGKWGRVWGTEGDPCVKKQRLDPHIFQECMCFPAVVVLLSSVWAAFSFSQS